MTTQQVRAGAAYVELTTRDNKLVAGLQKASKRLKAFAASMQQIGMSLFRGGVVSALPFGLSAKIFAGFEQQMARVKALTNANADEFAKLETKAKQLGAATVFSASQAAEAMSYFALAGFKTDQILGAIGPTLDLAAAGQIEIGEAADIATKIMAGMGIASDDLGNAVDVMAKAMTTANTDLLMLGEAFKFVGPMAKSAGISLEEITAAIQLLSNAGVQGEMAGTTLRGMLLSLTSPSAEAQTELKRLGVRVLDAAGDVRPLVEIISDLENAMSGVGSGGKLRVLGTIFPARQAAGAAELVSQGAERLREATRQLQSSSGTAAKIASTQLNTLQGDFVILTSALEGVAIAVGEAMRTVLRLVTQAVSKLLSILSVWISNNKLIVLSLVTLILGTITLGATLISLGITLKIIAFGLAGLASAVTIISSLFGFLVSPIGLVIVSLGALAGYLMYTSNVGTKALTWLAQKFGVLQTDATTAWKAIGDALASGDTSLAARILWLTLKLEWQRGVNYLSGLWQKFKGSFLSVTTEISFGAARILNDGWSAIESSWVETIGFLADAWSIFTTTLTQTWYTAVGFIRKAWVRLKSLFDSEINVQAEVDRINQETTTKNDQANQSMLSAIGGRDQQRRERQTQIEQNRQGTAQQLDQMQAQREAQLQADFDAGLISSQAELDAARQAWQDAIKSVKQPDPTSTEDPNPLAAIRNSLDASAVTLSDQQRQIESKGGFNALALQGIGADSLSERTAKASEQIATNTKSLVDHAKQGRLVFTA